MMIFAPQQITIFTITSVGQQSQRNIPVDGVVESSLGVVHVVMVVVDVAVVVHDDVGGGDGVVGGQVGVD